MTDSITHSAGGVMFAGAGAVDVFRAITLKSALNSYAKHGLRMNRALTPTRMLTLATEYTGVKYKRGEHAKAATDLAAIIDAKRAAIPETTVN